MIKVPTQQPGVWVVISTHPLRGRDRKQRIHECTLLADTPEEAVSWVKEADEGKKGVDYQVRPFSGKIISSRCWFRDVPKKTPPPKGIVDRLGSTERHIIDTLRGSSYPNGSWVWNTHRHTVRILDRLMAKGYVQKTEDGQYTLSEKGETANTKWVVSIPREGKYLRNIRNLKSGQSRFTYDREEAHQYDDIALAREDATDFGGKVTDA